MRDLGSKMSEIKYEAPLAQFDEWGGNDFLTKQTLSDTLNLNLKETTDNNILFLEEAVRDVHLSKNGSSPNCNSSNNTSNNSNNIITTTNNCNNLFINNGQQLLQDNINYKDIIQQQQGCGGSNNGGITTATSTNNVDNFTETFSGSLEDLVNTFDEKITKCFGNYEENVEDLAPVQVRSQEEMMNECQMWWTITGNFGNILPIDWSKSYARQMHMPTLNLQDKRTNNNNINNNNLNKNGNNIQTPDYELNDLSSEDEAVANDLDMHSLILNGLNTDVDEPIKTAEEVIKEIDDIMDEQTPSESDIIENEVMEKAKEVLGSPLYAEKLQSLTISQLNELYMEMEVLIQEFSETLINELALRDELEYEKELKNTFISLLLAVQNKRRQFHVEKKRGKSQGKQSTGLDPKYLTTVIPYHLDNGPPDNQALQVLIKILKAINEDSPTVPTLLTDYILKVLCPT